MMLSNQAISFLLSYGMLAAVIVVFLASIAVLVIKRRTLSWGVRAIPIAVMVICVLYLAFVLWVVIGFGSNSHPAPIQHQ